MSDTMLLGVLRMPINDDDPVQMIQFVARARQAADRIEADAKEIERMREVVEAARCIHHWHDSGLDGMVVSAEHVRRLWQALEDLDVIAEEEAKP